MAYLQPFVIHAGRRMAPEALSAEAERFRDLVIALRDGRLDPLDHLAPGFQLPPNFKPGGQ